jgi:hypothetical protein
VTSAQIGLLLFLVIIAVDVLALMVDEFLNVHGYTTITVFSLAHPWIAWLLVAWQLGAPVGLAWHFLTYR